MFLEIWWKFPVFLYVAQDNLFFIKEVAEQSKIEAVAF